MNKQALPPMNPDALPDDARALLAGASEQMGFTPNDVLMMAHWPALREHFTPRQIAEIIAVIGMFGFLNRWNATLRSPLESEPHEAAVRLLGPQGWSPGSHQR